jgi:chorismate mutase
MAMVSHAPQILSVALFKAAMEEDAAHGMLEVMAGRGFLDLTRLAASEFEVWKGILSTNAAPIRTALDRVESCLAALRSDMERGVLAESWGQVNQRRRRMGLERLPRMRLPEWRHLIDRCDEEILRALARRMHVASRIGTLKQYQESPVWDPERERRMMVTRHRWAEALDLPSPLVDELFEIIMKYSRDQQTS